MSELKEVRKKSRPRQSLIREFLMLLLPYFTPSVKDLALEELHSEKAKEAVIELKELYSKLEDAQKIVRNIEREIEDYLEELESWTIQPVWK